MSDCCSLWYSFLSNFFRDLHCFPYWLCHFKFLPAGYKSSTSPHPCQHLFYIYKNIYIYIYIYTYIDLVSISLILTDTEHFSYIYWSLQCLLWRNVYWSSLHIFLNSIICLVLFISWVVLISYIFCILDRIYKSK